MAPKCWCRWTNYVRTIRLLLKSLNSYYSKYPQKVWVRRVGWGGVGPEIRHFSKPPPLPLSYIPGESEVWPGLGISVGGLNWGETQDNQSWFAAFTLCKKCDHTYSHLWPSHKVSGWQGRDCNLPFPKQKAEALGTTWHPPPNTQRSYCLQVVEIWLELGPLDSHSRALPTAPTG